MPNPVDDVVARISIVGPGLMTLEERKMVARWLRGHATALVADGDKYTDKKYSARLHGPLRNYIEEK